ncbi:hypothetical protein RchiOBHm_Chr3g0492351 [Rosa chinensis]|uniref:Uncharacterized protein n=1 Tax=Rosa chinensis TaxID=74649 RepID=A0A2P6RGH0_ROSCH|nr:hypothetical protein RchiOBHm_Chr3g0492351 [Rosa chinensis]
MRYTHLLPFRSSNLGFCLTSRGNSGLNSSSLLSRSFLPPTLGSRPVSETIQVA